jgi:hypothetical protein
MIYKGLSSCLSTKTARIIIQAAECSDNMRKEMISNAGGTAATISSNVVSRGMRF